MNIGKNTAMKSFKKLLILCLSGALILTGTAHATDSWYVDDSAPDDFIGLRWIEDVTRGVSLSYLQTDKKICSTLSDLSCRNSNWTEEIILPPCSSKIIENCVVGMSVGSNRQSLIAGKLIRTINSPKIPEDKSLGVPYAGSASIWTVPGQNHSGGESKYAVIARLSYRGNSKTSNLTGFQASIVPVSERPDGGNYMRLIDVDTFEFHIGNCIYQEAGNCGVAQDWSDGAVGSLSLRIPKVATGWMYGRLFEPSLSVNSISGSQSNLLKIVGEPVTVQGSRPLVEFPNLPSKLETFLASQTGTGSIEKTGLYSRGGYVFSQVTDTTDSRWFDMWFPYTNDKADALLDYWNIKSIPNNFDSPQAQKCLGGKSIVGLVTSNSMLYTGSPPSFDGNALNYRVTGLHFMPDGKTPFLGSYDLVMRDSAAQCLYGENSLPASANVEIVNSDGNRLVATKSLVRENGWLRLSINGFTFSKPIIRVNLGSNMTNKSIAPEKSVICIKGKITTQVTAFKPTCPKGYKRK